jgi:RimJ/RimL family protein N-acetyltransferase
MLKNKSITLKPIPPEDLPILFEWINDREQVIFNAPYKPVTQKEHQEWFDDLQTRNDKVLFGIYNMDNKKIIGTCQLINIHSIHRTAELQIRIGEKGYRGKGFGKKAVLLLLKFAFMDLNLNRVYLHVFSNNDRAIHIYNKIGFNKEGVLRKSAYIDGCYVDIVVMGILSSEFKKN